MVFHGFKKTQRINGKDRDKQQANKELREHYEKSHRDIFDDEKEYSGDEMIDWNILKSFLINLITIY